MRVKQMTTVAGMTAIIAEDSDKRVLLTKFHQMPFIAWMEYVAKMNHNLKRIRGY